MPANLTPQYHKAEDQYRKAQTPEERVAALEEMLRVTPKHKGTDHLQADLKTKLKEAKADFESEKKSPRKGKSHKIPAQGAGQVVVIGAPNSGKTRILSELTKADVQPADYPFSTIEPSPGMMPWEDVQVQLIDTPPITDSHFESYLTGMVRAADACLLCFDGSSDDSIDGTATVIDQLAQRKTLLSDRTGFDEDDFSRVNVKTLIVLTRGRDESVDERIEFFREMNPEILLGDGGLPVLKVDLDAEADRETLSSAIYDLLGVMRIYTKKPGKPAEYRDPFTIPIGGTVDDLALRIHSDVAEALKFAKVWGTSAHDGQTVGRDHVLADRDMVEVHV